MMPAIVALETFMILVNYSGNRGIVGLRFPAAPEGWFSHAIIM
jgi:hypothetical protein